MLPFLKQRKEASVSSEADPITRKPDHEEDSDPLEVAMKELFNATSDKERAAAFRAAFDLLEVEPHEEVEHS